MNTLEELVQFTAVTSNAGRTRGFPHRLASLQAIGAIVPPLSNDERRSMRAMALALERLPPISLVAEIIGNHWGPPPFSPRFRIRPSAGVVLETVINYFRDGKYVALPEPGLYGGQEVLPDGQVVAPVAFTNPGVIVAIVTRRGITSTGPTVLEKQLSFDVRVNPPPNKPAPPVVQPLAVTCSAEYDLAKPGGGGREGVRIHGAGFVFPEMIDILDGQDVATSTETDEFGMYSADLSVLISRIPVEHVFHAHGRSSGRTSNNAGYTV